MWGSFSSTTKHWFEQSSKCLNCLWFRCLAKKSYQKFKIRLFRATITVKNSDNENYVYSDYGIKLDSAGWLSFDNDTARNDIILGGNNSSPSHADNRKNNF